MNPPVFYFDFISPYAFIAWTQLPKLAAELELEFTPKPVLFAGLLKASGGLGPAEIPKKRNYLVYDVARLAKRLDLSMSVPPNHPFNPLLGLRLVCAAAHSGQSIADQSALISWLYSGVWQKETGIETEEQLAKLNERLPFPGESLPDLIELTTEPAVKKMLFANTNEAAEAGAFGVPTVALGGELFWGYDSFPSIIDFAKSGSAVDEGIIGAWRNLTPSSERKR